jgi:hypothetical protein
MQRTLLIDAHVGSKFPQHHHSSYRLHADQQRFRIRGDMNASGLYFGKITQSSQLIFKYLLVLYEILCICIYTLTYDIN